VNPSRVPVTAGETEPKAKEDICDWQVLREQIKSDLVMAHK
jgi:hypothetical protein